MRWIEIWTERPESYHVLLLGDEGIAFCGLHRTGMPDVLECGFTGVLPLYSGRGLALALKAHALLKAKGGGAKRIVTSVHDDNSAMLAINRRLGFFQTNVGFSHDLR